MLLSVVVDFVIYACGSLLTRGISFIILPFIMHRIPPHEYGILSLLTAFLTISTALIGLGLRQVLSLEYFHADNKKRIKLIHEITVIYSCIGLPTALFSWIMRATINRHIFFNTVSSAQFLAVLISAFLFFYVELMYQLMQYQRQSKKLTLIQSCIAILSASGSLVSVFYFNAGITGIVWAQCSGTIITFIIAALCLVPSYQPGTLKQSIKKINYYLPYGLPFVPTILANWLLSTGDRWILGYYHSMQEVGIYAVADLATQLFYAIILVPWAGSYLPYIMEKYQKNSHNLSAIECENKKVMWLCMITLAIICTLGYPLATIIARAIVPASYLPAVNYAWFLLIGQIFLLGSYFCSVLIQYHKRTYFLAFSLFVPATINLLLNRLSTPIWGIVGCTISTLISYGIYFMMTYLFNRYLLTKIKKRVINDHATPPSGNATTRQPVYEFGKR